jgi:hypothetical protein
MVNTSMYGSRFKVLKILSKVALKIEVATCINIGEVVWLHDPFPGSRHDLTQKNRAGLKQQLHQGEKTWGKGSYRGDTKFQPGLSKEWSSQ